MNAWLLSIVGVVAMGVLLEILLGEGQTAKYIKGVFALAVVLVIVAPLPKFFDKNFDFDSVFGKEIEAQASFNSSFNKRRNDVREQELLQEFEKNELKVQRVRVFYLHEEFDNIDIVKIYAQKEQNEELLVQIASKKLKCEPNKIKVYIE